jgi:hypothetical protein
VDPLDRDGVQEVELLAPAALADHESRLLEYPQVLGDPEARHLEALDERAERLPVALEEGVEQRAPGGIGEGLEDVVHGKD